MAIRVCVTGASGFVGSHVVSALLERGYEVSAFARHLPVQESASVKSVTADLFDPASLDRAMDGCGAVIHLVGIIMEKSARGVTFERIHVDGTRRVIEAARRNRIERYVHMSALGTRPDAVSRYHQTKWQAEVLVRQSDLNWSIFRPSLIHGPGGFMEMEARWAKKQAPPYFAMPYFGAGIFGLGGTGLLQPVWVDDVARAFAEAIENAQSVRGIYDLVGPERFNWPDMHRMVSMELTGRPGKTLPMPVWVARLLAAGGLGPALGFSGDQVVMSQENNTGDPEPAAATFGWRTRAFRDALRSYAGKL